MPNTQRTQARHVATFIVRIVGTEHGDWRGQIDHVQSGRTLRFRNGIEALRFMDRQVNRKACDPAHVANRSVL